MSREAELNLPQHIKDEQNRQREVFESEIEHLNAAQQSNFYMVIIEDLRSRFGDTEFVVALNDEVLAGQAGDIAAPGRFLDLLHGGLPEPPPEEPV